MSKILCPNCSRILGDTNQSHLVASINCKTCKKAVKINMRQVSFDYFNNKEEIK